MSAWMNHVKKLKKQHPSKSLKDVLKMASKSYKKGGMSCGTKKGGKTMKKSKKGGMSCGTMKKSKKGGMSCGTKKGGKTMKKSKKSKKSRK